MITFKRKAYDRLLEWKSAYADRYSILLEGSRRVGKSTIVEAFVRNEYDSFILVDFSQAWLGMVWRSMPQRRIGQHRNGVATPAEIMCQSGRNTQYGILCSTHAVPNVFMRGTRSVDCWYQSSLRVIPTVGAR